MKPFDPSRITQKELSTNWESTKKFGRKFNEANFQLGDIDDTAVNEIVQRICKTLQKCKWVDHVEFDDIEDYFDVYTTDGRHFEFLGQEKPL